jgi:hypothetical protein
LTPPAGQGVRRRRVVVWQHHQARLQHDVIGIGDVQSDTVYGRLLVRALTRAQLGLSLMCLAFAVAVIASLPVVMALLPAVREVTVAGLPLTLVILGAGIFPVLMAVGWFYNRQASQLEARFIDLVDPVGRRSDD